MTISTDEVRIYLSHFLIDANWEEVQNCGCAYYCDLHWQPRELTSNLDGQYFVIKPS
jgi:hypothetical protein